MVKCQNTKGLIAREAVDGISTPVGADPKSLTTAQLEAAGHMGGPLLDVIRRNCLSCTNSQADVRRCAVLSCDFWPYRMGSNPWRTRELSEEQRAAAVVRLTAARAARQPRDTDPNKVPTVFKVGDLLITVKQREALDIIANRPRKISEIHGKTMNKLIEFGLVDNTGARPVLTDAGHDAAKALGVLANKAA